MSEKERNDGAPDNTEPEASAVAHVGDEQIPAALENVNRHEKKGSGSDPAKPGFIKQIIARALGNNAVLMRALAICAVLGATTTLKNGLMLSIAAVLVLIPLSFIMALFASKIPSGLFYPIALLISGVLFTPVYYFAGILAPQVTQACSFYLPVTAVNAALLLEPKAMKKSNPIRRALVAGIGDAAGYCIILILFSFFREIVALGTLYGKAVPDILAFRLGFFGAVPGVLLLLGISIAIVQAVKNRRASQDTKEGS